jgi:hypothetical protein
MFWTGSFKKGGTRSRSTNTVARFSQATTKATSSALGLLCGIFSQTKKLGLLTYPLVTLGVAERAAQCNELWREFGIEMPDVMVNISNVVALWKFENVTAREACLVMDAIASADRANDDWKMRPLLLHRPFIKI